MCSPLTLFVSAPCITVALPLLLVALSNAAAPHFSPVVQENIQSHAESPQQARFRNTKLELEAMANPQPPPPDGTSSLCFVFDTTGSMHDDLAQVKEGARQIFEMVAQNKAKAIYNYILVPFHDPEVGPVTAYEDANMFRNELNKWHLQGGGDCPEMVVSAVYQAAFVSQPSSRIYVFTDARSKDWQMTDDVLKLTEEKQLQITFVMTGDCGNQTHMGYNAFEEISRISNGQIFHLNKTDVHEVITYIRSTLSSGRVTIDSTDVEALGDVERQKITRIYFVPSDTRLHTLTFTVTCSAAKSSELHIQVWDPQNSRVEAQDMSFSMTRGNSRIITLNETLLTGYYRVVVESRGIHSFRAHGTGDIDFTHGFSAQRSISDISSASRAPTPHVLLYLFINVTGVLPGVQVKEVVLTDTYGRNLTKYSMSLSSDKAYLYHSNEAFQAPNQPFHIKVYGIDEEGRRFQRLTTAAIRPARPAKPTVYMPARKPVYFHREANLECTVRANVPYAVLFYHESSETPLDQQFFETSQTVRYRIPYVSRENLGEYRCEASNPAGKASVTSVLFGKEPPPTVLSRNVSAELYGTVDLKCAVANDDGQYAYTWKRVEHSILMTRRVIDYENGTLKINGVEISDEGGYQCTVTNQAGRATAIIYLKVIAPPRSTMAPEDAYFVPGYHRINFNCSFTGRPKPTINWFFGDSEIEFDNNKYYKSDFGENIQTLTIRNAEQKDVGEYQCRVSSEAGASVSVGSAYLAVPPRMKAPIKSIFREIGVDLTLDCRVISGLPRPTISWNHDDSPVNAMPHKYEMSERDGMLRIRNPQISDSGRYECIGENVAGRHRDYITLVVGTKPSISPVSSRTFEGKYNHQLAIPCHTTGTPTPEVHWEFNGSPLARSQEYEVLVDNSLLIRRLKQPLAGRYVCVAKNNFGSVQDYRTAVVIGLDITVLFWDKPVVVTGSTEIVLKEGDSQSIVCTVMIANPPPAVLWKFKGQADALPRNSRIRGSGATDDSNRPFDFSLDLNDVKKGVNDGVYTCTATNIAGSGEARITVRVLVPPTIKQDQIHYEVSNGHRFSMPCTATGDPPPRITWQFAGRPLPNGVAQQSDGSVKVFNAEQNMQGTYTCVATNKAGTYSRNVKVSVLVKPRIDSTARRYDIRMSQSITMVCKAHGSPKPIIEWWFGSQKVLHLPGQHIYTDDGSLVIRSVKAADSGKYRCVALNKAGRDQIEVVLNVFMAPKIDQSAAGNLVRKVGTSVAFPCVSRAESTSRTWKNEGRVIHLHSTSDYRNQNDGSLYIEHVKMTHQGTYECEVTNMAGSATVTYTLTVISPPKITLSVPGTVSVTSGMRLSVPCAAAGIPAPEISWKKDGILVSSIANIREKDGNLIVEGAQRSHSGQYTCVATNSAGVDQRLTSVIVQELPKITDDFDLTVVAIEAKSVELRCRATGIPQPKINWYTNNGEKIESPGTSDFEIRQDGTLVIRHVRLDLRGGYECQAVNLAGSDSKTSMVSLIAAPKISGSGETQDQTVREGDRVPLYCPVTTTPTPNITWEFENVVISDSRNPNFEFSKDFRRMIIKKIGTEDAGLYKCTARNRAGKVEKKFLIKVNVPPYYDGSLDLKFKKLIGERFEVECPAQGTPDPTFTWIVNGRLLAPGASDSGAQISSDGEKLVINSVQMTHEGNIVCTGTNPEGQIQVDIQLGVIDRPVLGEDEVLRIRVGSNANLQCRPESEDSNDVNNIQWKKDEADSVPKADGRINIQKELLFIRDAKVNDAGVYECSLDSVYGTISKKITVIVQMAPEFRTKEFQSNVIVPRQQSLELQCYVTGQPAPTVTWRKDDEEIDIYDDEVTFEDRGQKMIISRISTGKASQYTCKAENVIGEVRRDFFVQMIEPPDFGALGNQHQKIEREKGKSVRFNCKTRSGGTDLTYTWKKDGKTIPNDARYQLGTADHETLRVDLLVEADEGIYACQAANPAGNATITFELDVIVRPAIFGDQIETIERIEGEPVSMDCDFTANPPPVVTWTNSSRAVDPIRAHVSGDNRTLAIDSVHRKDQGTYICNVRNRAGYVEKIIHLKVIVVPSIFGADSMQTVKVEKGKVLILNCSVGDEVTKDSQVTFAWYNENVMLSTANPVIQLRSDSKGTKLYVNEVAETHAGNYRCQVKNVAGEAQKRFKVMVLIPPRITSPSKSYHIAINETEILNCHASGYPEPQISWTKDGTLAEAIPNIKLLDEGKTLKIVRAMKIHGGKYVCLAKNVVGQVDVDFHVTVIQPPRIDMSKVQDHVTVIENATAEFNCPVDLSSDVRQITWMFGNSQIDDSGAKYTTSNSKRLLRVFTSKVADEGSYKCVVRNRAGNSEVLFRLTVNIPPTIQLDNNDLNKREIRGSSLILTCPATGKPGPRISWLRNGVNLTEDTIEATMGPGVTIIDNDLKLEKLTDAHNGKINCVAENAAGVAEKEYKLNIIFKPVIDRQDIRSDIGPTENQSITINCIIKEAKPYPEIIWYKDEAVFSPDSDTNAYIWGGNQRLNFVKVRRSDAGVYTCVAKNRAGEDKRSFKVEVMIHPFVRHLPRGPPHSSINDREGSTQLMVPCTFGGVPTPTVQWLLNDQHITETPGKYHISPATQEQRQMMGMLEGEVYEILHILNPTSEDSAHYMCVAKNVVGLETWDTMVVVADDPKLVGDATVTLRVIEGDMVTLMCDATGDEGKVGFELKHAWHRDGRFLGDGDWGQQVRGSQKSNMVDYTMIGDEEKVHFASVSRDHAGTYVCTFGHDKSQVKQTIKLTVLVRPTFIEKETSPTIVESNLNDNIALKCVVEGLPTPTIEWRKGDVEIATDHADFELSNGNSVLRFSKASKDMAGSYTCGASNEAGKIQRQITVIMKGPPEFDQKSVTRKVKVGSFVMVGCRTSVLSDQQYTFSWSIDNEKVEEGTELYTKYLTGNDKTQIMITSATLEDSHKFTCVVENEVGSATKDIILIVQQPPRFTSDENTVQLVRGQPKPLDCQVEGFPMPTVQWQKVNKQAQQANELTNARGQFFVGQQQYRITAAGEEDAGTYTCTASNEVGEARKVIVAAILPKPAIGDTPENVDVHLMAATRLHCPATPTGVEIKWLKHGVPVDDSNTIRSGTNGEYLHFRHATTADAGVYTCRARNDAGEATRDINLTVLVKPEITRPDVQEEKSNINETVTFICPSQGIPKPTISWLIDDKVIDPEQDKTYEILQDGSTLKINQVKASHKARFTCDATNVAGSDKINIYLSVLIPPKFDTGKIQYEIVEGTPYVLNCDLLHGSGVPTPEITWMFEAKNLATFSLTDGGRRSSYFVRSATREHEGRYFCGAKNEAGSDRLMLTVLVLQPPVITNTGFVKLVDENKSVTLSCRTTGNPTPTITWRFNGQKVVDLFNEKPGKYVINGDRLTLNDAKEVDSGRYECIAKNKAGEERMEIVVDVLFGPSFTEFERSYTAIEAAKVTMECSAIAKPEAKISWLKAGAEIRPSVTDTNVLFSPKRDKLVIRNVKKSDAGTYECRAQNKVAAVTTHIDLKVYEKPYWEVEPQMSQKKNKLPNQIIDCPVLGDPKPQVKFIVNGTKEIVFDDVKYSLDHDRHLKIIDVTEWDKGVYRCIATNIAGSIQTDIHVSIIGEPKFNFNSVTDYSVIEGESVTMDCIVNDEDGVAVTWKQGEESLYLEDNYRLSEDNQHLTISDVKLKNAGGFTCSASNSIFTSELTITLSVWVRPAIDDANLQPKPMGFIGRSLEMECPISAGLPQPTMKWYKNGLLLEAGSSEKLTSYNQNQRIRLTNLSETDEAEYKCTASNQAGDESRTFNVIIAGKPTMSRSGEQSIIIVEGETQILECPFDLAQYRKHSPTNPDIEWEKDGENLIHNTVLNVDYDESKLTIKNADYELHRGKYVCVVQNPAGRVNFMYDVVIHTAPAIAGRLNFRNSVNEGQELSLYCRVKGFPEPKISWFRDNEEVTSSTAGYQFDEDGKVLVISSATSTQGGNYRCIAENVVKRDQIEVFITVNTGAQVTLLGPDTATRGETIRFTCAATGNPAPSIKWNINGLEPRDTRLTVHDNHLEVPNVSANDQGVYKCTADNLLGPVVATKTLTILIAPKLDRSVTTEVSLRVDEPVTLQCKIEKGEGFPLPTYKWLDADGFELAEGSIFTTNTVSDHLTKGVKCVASNSVGNDELMYTIELNASPSIAPVQPVFAVRGESTTIECKASGKPKPQMKFLFRGQVISTNDLFIVGEDNVKILSVDDRTTGIYLCQATNNAGSSQASIMVDTITEQAPVTGGTFMIRVINSTILLSRGQVIDIGCPDSRREWWTKDGDRLSADFDITDKGASKLEAELTDSGFYNCTIKTDSAMYHYYASLTVLDSAPMEAGLNYEIYATRDLDIRIECPSLGHQVGSWVKKAAREGESDLVISSNDKFQLEELQGDPNGALIIVKMQAQDAGIYECRKEALGDTVSTITFEVIFQAMPVIDQENSMVEVVEGVNVELRCSTMGVPQPEIKWTDLRDPRKDISGQQTKYGGLKIYKISRDMAGRYKCTAKNSVGEAVRIIVLSVVVPPKIDNRPLNVTAENGTIATLTCKVVDGDRPVNLTWHLENSNEPIEGRVDTIDGQGSMEVVGNDLRFVNVQPEHDAFYRCVATNAAGSATAFKKLSIKKHSWNYVRILCFNDIPHVPKEAVERGDLPDDYAIGEVLVKSTVDYQAINMTDGTMYLCDNMIVSDDTTSRLARDLEWRQLFPKDQTVEVGEKLELVCSLTKNTDDINDNLYVVRWYFNGQKMEDQPSTINRTSRLVKNSVETSDTGQYSCRFYLLSGDSDQVELQATGQVTVKNMNVDTSESVEVAILSCEDSESNFVPNAQFHGWGAKPDKILTIGNTLVFLMESSITLDSMTCGNDINHFGIVTKEIKVVQTAEPRISMRPTVRIIRQKFEYGVTFKCHSTSDEDITKVEWFRDGQLVPSVGRVRVDPVNVLNITDWVKSDEGDYICRLVTPYADDVEDSARVVFMTDKIKFGHWSQWSQCNSSCAPAVQKRHRICYDGTVQQLSTLCADIYGEAATDMKQCLDLLPCDDSMPTRVVGVLSGNVNGIRIEATAIYADLTPGGGRTARLKNAPAKLEKLAASVITTQYDSPWLTAECQLPGNTTAQLNGYSVTGGRFHEITNVDFEGGENLRMEHDGKGLDSQGHIIVDVLVDGSVPKTNSTMQSLKWNPYSEQLVQLGPGRLYARGSGSVNVGGGRHVTMNWHRNITYSNSDIVFTNPAHQINVEVLNVNDDDPHREQVSVKSTAQITALPDCPTGFRQSDHGRFCEDVDECGHSSAVCRVGQSCVNTKGSYQCLGTCAMGLRINSNGDCEDIDECALGFDECGNNPCVNTHGAYICETQCRQGFKRQGDICIDIDECHESPSQPCTPDKRCRNIEGGFECKCPYKQFSINDREPCESQRSHKLTHCPSGYHYSKALGRCVVAGSMCQLNCQYECVVDIFGGNHCICPSGYALSPDDISCIDIDECKTGPDKCGDDICFNTLGNFACLELPCPTNFSLTADQRMCVEYSQDSYQNIQLLLVPLIRGIQPNKNLIKLTALDSNSAILRDTEFELEMSHEVGDFPDDYESLEPPFGISTDRDGFGYIYSTRDLIRPTLYRMRVRAESWNAMGTNYKTQFILYVSVSQWKF